MSSCHPQAHWVVQMSTCPSSRWHTLVAPLLASPEMLYLTVGANKGYGVSEFLQRYTGVAVDNRQWLKLLERFECRRMCCGVCRPCTERRLPMLAGTRSVRVEAFEMQHNSAASLRRVLEAAVPAGSAVHTNVHEVAVSNASGWVWSNPNVKSGVENLGASFVPRNARWVQRRSCLLYTSPSPRDRQKSRMPSSA